MKLSFPITKDRIRTHFTYAWWQYALLIVIAIFGWNLIHTTTRYRSPEHLKVEWYSEGVYTEESQRMVDGLLAELHTLLFPEMEEVTYTNVSFDSQYGDMQLMVWIAAGQGDLYMLNSARYQGLASSGAFLDLQPYVDDGTLNVDGLDLTVGYVKDEETGKKVLRGIPADQLKKLNEYGIITEGRVLAMLGTGGNDENTVKLFQWLLENMRGE